MSPNKRQFERYRHRIACEFTLSGRQHTGFVADISACGVFVFAATQPEPGCEIDIILREPSFGELRVRGRVTRVSRSHRSVKVVVPPGFAISLESAPEAFFELLLRLGIP